MNRWKEHFQSVLNCPEPTITFVADDTDANTQLPINVDPFSENEVRLAIKQLKNGKAAGVDNIQSELMKYADSAVPHLTNVCNMVWQEEHVPADWRNGIIIPLPKKGDLTECSNWQGNTTLGAMQGVYQSTVEPHARCHGPAAPTTTSRVQAWKIVHRPNLHPEADN